MDEQDRALALVGLAAAIERALNTSLTAVAHRASARDELTERLLQRNLVQLAHAAAELRQSAIRLMHDGRLLIGPTRGGQTQVTT